MSGKGCVPKGSGHSTAPQGSGHRAAGAPGAFGHCSQTQGLGLCGVVWSWGLDPMVLGGPFQLGISYDSMVAIRVLTCESMLVYHTSLGPIVSTPAITNKQINN